MSNREAANQRDFDQHQFLDRGYRGPVACQHLSADDVPPAPHNTPERPPAVRTPSSSKRNVMSPTLSPVISPHNAHCPRLCSQCQLTSTFLMVCLTVLVEFGSKFSSLLTI